jgi:serine/threonine-protein kinase
MSPEQVTARDVDGRSDLFSLGCTMYHLLSGEVPFPGVTVAECFTRRMRGSPIPITELRSDLPPQLVQVLDKLMAQRPEDRFQSAAEAFAALEPLVRREGLRRCDHQPSPPPAMHARVPAPPPAPAASTAPDSPPTVPLASSSPPLRSGSRLPALPSVRILLCLLAVGLVIFMTGFALGRATALVMPRGGPSTHQR